ncbi:hypothetical protein V8E53_013141 [Lactarius tabidus]
MAESSPPASTAEIAEMRSCIESIKLEVIKKELATKQTFNACWETIHRVENLLNDDADAQNDAQNQTVTFSTVSPGDLMEVGVEWKHLYLVGTNISKLTKELTTDAGAQIADLNSRIEEIYECVNMDMRLALITFLFGRLTLQYDLGARIILDAILLALRKISSTQQRDVAIIPTMSMTTGQDDVTLISHPVSGYQLRLSGKVDYAMIDYDDDEMGNMPLLVVSGGYRAARRYIENHNCLFPLVEAKYRGKGLTDGPPFIDCIPKAVSQAIVMLKSAKLPEVRFCLSDGERWKFFILKSEGDTLTYYDSGVHYLSMGRDGRDVGRIPLAELAVLLREWMRPTVPDLYELT